MRSQFQIVAVSVILVSSALLARRVDAQDSPRTTSTSSADVGAARWLPADAGIYWARFGMAQQIRDIQSTRAFQRFWRLPAVQLGLTQLRATPEYQQVIELLESPQTKPMAELVIDALSHEIFVHGDARAVAFAEALGRFYGRFADAQIASLSQGFPSAPELGTLLSLSLVRWLVFGDSSFSYRPTSETASRDFSDSEEALFLRALYEDRAALKAPNLLVGFKVSDPKKVIQLLGSLADSLPIPLADREFDDGKGAQWFLEGSLRELVPEFSNPNKAGYFQQIGLSKSEAEDLSAYLDDYKVCIGVGVRKGYFVLSVGESSAPMDRLGKGPSLMENALLSKVAAKAKCQLRGLAYVRAKPIPSNSDEGLRTFLRSLLETTARGLSFGEESTDKLSEKTAAQIESDVKTLAPRLAKLRPESKDYAAVSFQNQGAQKISYGPAPLIALDTSKALTLLSKTGKNSLFSSVSRQGEAVEAIKTMTQCLSAVWGYLERSVQSGGMRNLDGAKEALQVYGPFFAKINRALSDHILPNLDGQQTLLTIDDQGVIRPDITGATRDIGFPQPALVLQVKDSDDFMQGLSEVGQALDLLIQNTEKLDFPSPPFDRFPRPAKSKSGSHDLYQYSGIPVVRPHARVLRSHVVFGLSLEQTQGILASKVKLPKTPVDLVSPAGQIVNLRLDRSLALILTMGTIALETAGASGTIDRNALGMVLLHLPELQAISKTLKRYRLRVYEDAGFNVNHSWFQFEDLPAN